MSPMRPPSTRRHRSRSPNRHRSRRSFGSVPQAHEQPGSVNSMTSMPSIAAPTLLLVYGRAFYDAVGDALMGFLPPSFRDFEWYRTGHNIKVWYGDDGKEHY